MKRPERFSSEPVLLRLYRQYGKDETFKALFDEISNLKLRVGELTSECAELQAALAVAKAKRPKTSLTEDLQRELNVKRKKNSQLERTMNEWRNKALELQIKLDKLK